MSEKNKKLISIVKQGDLESFSKNQYTLEDLSQRINNHSVISWVKINRHQALLDHIYQAQVTDYFSSRNNVPDLEKRDSEGLSLLHWAVRCYQSTDLISAIIASGLDVDNITHTGATPLHIAAYNGHLKVVQHLLAKGADVNAACTNGATPLHIAAYKCHLEVVQHLLAKDADVNAARTDNGATPLQIAKNKGHKVIIQEIYKAELQQYISERGADNAPEYTNSLNFFGHTMHFGYSKQEKIAAAKALKEVFIDKSQDLSSLEAHKNALNNGRLKEIYTALGGKSDFLNRASSFIFSF